jgi:hypothetical protein
MSQEIWSGYIQMPVFAQLFNFVFCIKFMKIPTLRYTVNNFEQEGLLTPKGGISITHHLHIYILYIYFFT